MQPGGHDLEKLLKRLEEVTFLIQEVEMKILKLFAAGAALAMLAVPAQADRLDDIIASGKLRCAVTLDFPPIGMRDANNEPVGFDVDLSKAIAAPVGAMSRVMGRLASGDNTVNVPAIGRKDEIGEMAQAVLAFKDAAIEKLRLEADAAEHRAAVEAFLARVNTGA